MGAVNLLGPAFRDRDLGKQQLSMNSSRRAVDGIESRSDSPASARWVVARESSPFLSADGLKLKLIV
jgi:hypothetical protein